MNKKIARIAALAIGLAIAFPGFAAVIPPGVQLHPTQTLIRNNGSEPETLDPAVAESVGANNITRDLFEGLTNGEYCFVLNTRQMGKSSLMVRTAARLREAGVRVAVLDLTGSEPKFGVPVFAGNTVTIDIDAANVDCDPGTFSLNSVWSSSGVRMTCCLRRSGWW